MKQKAILFVLALAFAGLTSAAPTKLTFCTGGEGGFYESLGQAIGKAITKTTGGELVVLNTGGSVENADLLKGGDCDIAIIQADAVVSQPLPTDIKVSDAHTEVAYWLHGKDGVDDFGKMETTANAERYAVASVAGSGGLVTLKNFAKTDSDYEDVRVVEFDDWYSAAEAVAQGYVTKAGVRVEIAGMIYVGRLNFITSDITEDFAKQILIGEINDDSFEAAKDANNNPLYTHCSVPGGFTSGLATSTAMAPDTYCLRAQVVYNNDYHKGLDAKEIRVVRRAVDKGINGIVKAVR